MTQLSDNSFDTDLQNEDVIMFDLGSENTDVDEIIFKPLTDGLGFKKPKDHWMQPSHSKLEKPSHSRDFAVAPVLPMTDDKSSCVDIFASHKAVPEEELISNQEFVETEPELTLVSKSRLFFAWLTDVIIICLLISITLTMFLIVPGARYSDLIQGVSRTHLFAFSTAFFAIYYTLYFALLDYFNTPGKFLFKLILVGETKISVTLLQTFIRAFVSLASFLALGVPLILDFQGKLSDTKIVERR